MNTQGPVTPTSLRDIFRYTPASFNRHDGQNMIQTDNPYAQVNNSELNDRDFYNQFLNNSSFSRNDQGQWNINQGSFLDQVNQQYGANFGLGTPNSDGKLMLQGDYSKLPKSKLGSVDRLMPVDENSMQNLRNPKLVYDDPVYGKVTRIENWKSNNEWMGPALMMAATAGMGALAGPGAQMGLRAVQAGRSIGQGGSPWGAALSMFGGSLGNISGIGDISKFLSGPAGFAARYGLSQAMGRRRSGQGG